MSSLSPTRRHFLRATGVVGLSLPLSGFTWLEAMLAPKAEPWPLWTQHDNTNTARIDHTPWTAFLATYVQPSADGINRVRYAEVSDFDGRGLSGYLDYLTALPIAGYARAEQRAYWINLYNARTVRLVLDHYPLDSIFKLDISPGLLSFGPWGKKLVMVGGIELSLNDIEHRILRAGWSDNRLHYALNCASLGCPNLQPAAFTRANSERLLVDAAGAYINHPRGVSVAGGALTASKIYAWFKADFGDYDAAVVAHFRRYARPELKAALDGVTAISAYEYDWSLNDLARRPE